MNLQRRWAAADHSDLIFVCLHFNLLEKYLKTTTTSALIVDVCSSKELIVRIANERNLRMIGGHPMAGNEQKGERGWDVRLFQKAPFFLCPAGISTPADRRKLTSSAFRKLGCQPIVVNPVKHDEAVAITSHLPAFACALLYEISAWNSRGIFWSRVSVFYASGTDVRSELLQTFMKSNKKNIRKAAAKSRELATTK